ncbi:MAG: cupin domain-containing protein [Methanobrevibacter sp.]|nr:cupin domain-containing protein [Methanobrevibacter sp.]
MIEKVNLEKTVEKVSKLFQYTEIGKLNYHILNVVQVENRTLDFHVHEDSDELFYVIEGTFDMELEDGIVSMFQGDMIIIPKGILHRPVCKSLVKCLIINLEGTLNKKNTGKI